MSEVKCNKCNAYLVWLETDEGWRPFDYGKKMATLETPLISSEGEEVTSGLGFLSHFGTCRDRIKANQAKAVKEQREREERKRKQKHART